MGRDRSHKNIGEKSAFQTLLESTGMSDILYDSEQRRKGFAGSELDFIRMEISLALTFLDRADTTESPKVRNRNRENAQKAHDEAASRMARHSFENAAEREDAEAALLVLTNRLKAFQTGCENRPIRRKTRRG